MTQLGRGENNHFTKGWKKHSVLILILHKPDPYPFQKSFTLKWWVDLSSFTFYFEPFPKTSPESWLSFISSQLTSQLMPWKPLTHEQEYSFPAPRSSCSFLHDAPFRQGADAHGSYGKLHVRPMNLGVQLQENELMPSTHVAPF